MFKMFPPTFFVVPIAWLTALMLSLLNVATPALEPFGITPRTSWAVLVVQLVLTAFFFTPLWRLLWRLVPPLNRWVFPDLNGEWELDLETNWSRIDATLKAAKREAPKLDSRDAPEHELAALNKRELRARISQSWADINMVVWDSNGEGPIKESETLAVQPFRGKEGRHGLVYVFEQENESPLNSDDRKFYGAARLVVDRHDPAILCGQMWTDRMWRRGMNTAASVRCKRKR